MAITYGRNKNKNFRITMWEAIKDILKKKACFHDWKLVKEVRNGLFHHHFIYICNKCGEIKRIDIND